MAEIKISVEDRLSYRSEQLIRRLGNERVRKQCCQFIGNALIPYVPMKTGALRSSMKVYPDKITWGEDKATAYARYQYGGYIYAPNFAQYALNPSTGKRDYNHITGWLSPQGEGSKYMTNRRIGSRSGYWRGWLFGYSTPGTTYEWKKMYKEQLKLETNKKITAYMKSVLRSRGKVV